MSGYLRTAVLLAGLTALFMVVGHMLGGRSGMMIALVLALGMNVFSYWNSGNMLLSMYDAYPVDESTSPQLVRMVQQLSENAGLPMPRVYIMENDQPNAFATGRNPAHAAVAVTTGLMRLLSREEIAGVLAHELAHIKNRDTLIMTITATLAGAISMLGNFGLLFGGGSSHSENGESGGSGSGWLGGLLLMILAPLAAMLVQMAISRSREYEADREGAAICGQPLWLASALDRIARGAESIDNAAAESRPATAHLFIINPLHGGSVARLFSTHPATGERVRRLEEMAGRSASRGAPRPWG